MLQRSADDGGGVLVVVDGVFSMEGDIAPLPRIVELFRPSVQSSSCLYEMNGTPRACADATIASSFGFGAALSLWMLMPKAP